MASSDNDEGALGCLIGVIVLVFAAVGFTIAADKLQKHRNRAPESIPENRDYEDELITLTAKEQVLRRHLEDTQAKNTKSRAKLAELSHRTDDSTEKLRVLHAEKRLLETDIRSLEAEIQLTAQNLVKRARMNAMQEPLPVLRLNNGSVYRDARITAIHDDRIRIQHAEGSANIEAGLLEPAFRAKLGLKSTGSSP